VGVAIGFKVRDVAGVTRYFFHPLLAILRISLTWSEATSVFFYSLDANAFMLSPSTPLLVAENFEINDG
jgi:hypothetical protein